MEQSVFVSLPAERPARRSPSPAPSSEIGEIRALFRSMSREYWEHQPPDHYFVTKRIVDILVSGILSLLLLSWIFPIVALLIKLTSRGPIFFIQKRTGLHGAEFSCLKFRTMRVNDEAHTRQATANDDRITSIGRILRVSHIDELPQLLNVLLGDMSLVGPRPHMVYHTRYYAQKIPYYNLRHEAAPGFTGMAQIKGYMGEITADRELWKRIQWDVYYLRHRSLGLDLHILWMTVVEAVQRMLPKGDGKSS